MDQSNSKWTRWIAIALCALALNAARRSDDPAPPRQGLRTTASADQPESPRTSVAGNR